MLHRQIQDKLTQDDIKADLGVQTVYSSTGFSTVNENIIGALQMGMEYLAITDYIDWAVTEDTPMDRANAYIRSLYELKDVRINLIAGLELSFMPAYSYSILNLPKLKWLTASNYANNESNYYSKSYIDRLKSNITQAVRYGINAVAHPEQNLHYLMSNEYINNITSNALEDTTKEFFDWLVDYCKEKNLYMGISEYSLHDPKYRKSAEYWIQHAIDNDNLIYLNTDARLCTAVGDFEETIQVCNRLGVRKQYILNCDIEKLHYMFGGTKS